MGATLNTRSREQTNTKFSFMKPKRKYYLGEDNIKMVVKEIRLIM